MCLAATLSVTAEDYKVAVSEEHEPMMTGKYAPTWESLSEYSVPEWFRDAKFGIWAHWGPQCVEGSGDWMRVNGEAIYSTRPWQIFGEGPIASSDIKLNAQGFNEGAYTKATAEEIRFTQTKDHLYAIALSWPESGMLTVGSLGTDSEYFGKKIRSVELLGYGKVPFTRDAEGLKVKIPADATKSPSPVLKIRK